MSTDPSADDSEVDRDDLERDLVEWFKTQDYSEAEVEQVLEKMRRFDARTLQESFFASVGTGSIEFNDMIDSILSEHSDKPSELELVIDKWGSLEPSTRKAIFVLAQGKLPPATHQAVIALIDSLPPS